MPVPQRLTVVTFGARSVPTLRAFYRAIGWEENDGSDDTYTSFTLNGVRLALYPIELLGEEAAPQGAVIAPGVWNGITLGINVASREQVERAFEEAVAAGGRAIEAPAERSWGGASAYVADPEGHRWEIAWAPWLTSLD